MAKFVEIRSGDIVIFKEKSGKGSFVQLDNNDIYFVPAKKEMRLSGKKMPIRRNEAFVFSGSTVLETKGSTRIVKINLTRLKTGQTCYVSEFNLHKYFAKPENHLPYVENY